MVEDLAHAELEIIRSLQCEHFEDEIKVLQSLNVDGEFLNRTAAKERNSSLKKTSCLYRLDPYLDADGVLRIGGRLRRANLPDSVKHPVILPKESHITRLIIQDSHRSIKHQGSGMTHNDPVSVGTGLLVVHPQLEILSPSAPSAESSVHHLNFRKWQTYRWIERNPFPLSRIVPWITLDHSSSKTAVKRSSATGYYSP